MVEEMAAFHDGMIGINTRDKRAAGWVGKFFTCFVTQRSQWSYGVNGISIIVTNQGTEVIGIGADQGEFLSALQGKDTIIL